MNTKQKHDDHEPNDFCGVGIQFEINAESNATLTRTAHIEERSKRSEAKLRLQDHLKRFPHWKP
ncbi:MAG: TraY domain-containing protein [Photobacterium frigidiphilum]|uniref:TraY domain-containing protein n=1 Tax=Photobacterium frigidiphilum TaxID=264736 RepID=UPI003003A0A1